ncbi:hypothetical protein PaeBR_15210 [Paenibacillus sp. BR2-3]|uniref:hypothetical protein n=1 Tax=Paenibacillus sp. BR2-3 TaxID=3048494 RepID=UPI00397741D4
MGDKFKPIKNATVSFSNVTPIGNASKNKVTPDYRTSGSAALESIATSELSYSGGGGGGMDDILRRLEKVETSLSNMASKEDLRELGHVIRSEMKDQTSEIKDVIQQSLSKVPNEDAIKNIISDKSKNLGLATETFVESQIGKETSKMILWMVGISITVTGVASTILFNVAVALLCKEP